MGKAKKNKCRQAGKKEPIKRYVRKRSPIPLKLDKPVPNLKTIILTSSPESDVVITDGSPPNLPLVNLYDSPPHIPGISIEVSNTNPPKSPPIIDANTFSNTVQESSEEMGKKKSRAQKLKALLDARRQVFAIRMKGAAQTTTEAAAESSTQGAAQSSTQAVAQSTTQAVAQRSKQAATQSTTQSAAQSTTQATAAQTTTLPAKQTFTPTALPGIIQTSPNTYILNRPQTFNNQQKKKWRKLQNKIDQKLMMNKNKGEPVILPEEPVLPEMSQDGSPSVIGQTSESPTSVSTDGSCQPISVQKPSITLRTKNDMRLNWVTRKANKLGPSALVSQEPQSVKTPQPTPVAGLPVGSTIPTLENRTVQHSMEPTPRSSAGSFFNMTAPSQPPSAPLLRAPNPTIGENYAYRYPKGIPKSFLVQQEKALEPGGLPITADSPIWPSNPMMNTNYPSAILLGQQPPDMNEHMMNMNPATSPILVQTENPVDIQQPYSPSDIYSEQAGANPEPPEVDAESTEQNQSGQKRLSAFHRLGPLSQPKKPKLTINLNLKKDQPVREVVNETDDDPDKYTPVHLRYDMIMSSDTTVMKYLPCWPWRKNIAIRKSATARNSMSVMILEQEKMEEAYEKENIYIQISVKGYPSTWTKMRVLDAVLDNVKGYSLIPCFTEFTQHECKFLVLRSRSALIVLHKTGFYIHKDGVELTVTISLPIIPDKLDFIPKIIIRKRMLLAYSDKKLDLSAFTLQNDISHFIYFPLNRVTNQRDLLQLQTSIGWDRLEELDLSHNNLTTISGLDLIHATPKLKHLNLSHNCLEKITALLDDRHLPLTSIQLEGNPLCHDYVDPEHYVRVIRMMFPAVVKIDGVRIQRKGELPNYKPSYCPEEAQEVTEKFLEIFFPLLDSEPDNRSLIQGMYEDEATLTVTYCYKLRYSPIYRNFRNLFLYARFLDEGETDSVVGAMAITKLLNRWPQTEHDPTTFIFDTLYHTETTTILRVSGVLKLTSETSAEDEHQLSFTRTVVLYSEDGSEYKIQNEMVYWVAPVHQFKLNLVSTPAAAKTTISQKNPNLKIEATTDEDLRDKFLKIFMKLTTMDKKISERCLEINNWNFKLALEHFMKLLKQNNLDSLTEEVQVVS